MNFNKEIDFSNEMRPSASPPLTYPKTRIATFRLLCCISYYAVDLLNSTFKIRALNREGTPSKIVDQTTFGTNSTATNNNIEVFVHFSYPEIFVC